MKHGTRPSSFGSECRFSDMAKTISYITALTAPSDYNVEVLTLILKSTLADTIFHLYSSL